MKPANGHDIDDAEADWHVSPVVLFQSEPDMIPTRRFCELTRVSSKTVLRLIRSRKLPGCKIGRAYFVPKTSLIEYAIGGGGLDEC